jgi:hypothetical protein
MMGEYEKIATIQTSINSKTQGWEKVEKLSEIRSLCN